MVLLLVGALIITVAQGGSAQARLEQAIEKKDIAAIRAVVATEKATARAKNGNGVSLLSLAAGTDCVECAKALLDAGADVKVRDTDKIGRWPLHWAGGGQLWRWCSYSLCEGLRLPLVPRKVTRRCRSLRIISIRTTQTSARKLSPTCERQERSSSAARYRHGPHGSGRASRSRRELPGTWGVLTPGGGAARRFVESCAAVAGVMADTCSGNVRELERVLEPAMALAES